MAYLKITHLAFRWCQRAAEHEDFLGCVKLGEMYTNGVGIMKDYIKALHWNGIAAEGENAALPRQRFAEVCLLTACDGDTITRAYELTSINVDRTLFDTKDASLNLLKQLTQRMSPEQIDQGHNLAKAWEGRNPEPKPPL